MDSDRVTKNEFLENFIVENQYGESPIPWPRTTISLCKIVCDGNTADPIYKIHRSDGLHAEERLIKDLQEDTNVIAAKKIVIHVYQNYSPCSGCAETIEDYMTGMIETKDVSMTITFANFYKTHEYPGNSGENAERNIEGLKCLVNSGVNLQVFGVHQEWESVLGISQFFDLSEADKEECVQRANSLARKLREETDQRFLQEEIYEEDTHLERQMEELSLSRNNNVE